MDRILARSLLNCEVRNGRVQIDKSGCELEDVANELRMDVLRMRVPHTRVIGIKASGSSECADYITKIKGVGRSYADLLRVMNDIVMADVSKGESQQIGRFVAIGNITSSNGAICQEGCGEEAKVSALIQNVNIAKLASGGGLMRFITRRTTGLCDFKVSEGFIGEEADGYVAMRAVYDLNSIITVKMYEANDEVIQINYKRDVDERVLEQIIREYARDIVNMQE